MTRRHCPETEHRRYKKRYKTPRYRAQVLTAGMKRRAESKGLPFDLTWQWVLERIEDGACEVTGIEFDFESRAFCPSIDQRIPGEGYTADNAQVVCWIYNAAKGVSTHEEVVRFADALSRVG